MALEEGMLCVHGVHTTHNDSVTLGECIACVTGVCIIRTQSTVQTHVHLMDLGESIVCATWYALY